MRSPATGDHDFDVAELIGGEAGRTVVGRSRSVLLNEPAAEPAVVVDLLDRWFDRWLTV